MLGVRGGWHAECVIPDWLRDSDEVAFVHHRDARAGQTTQWPSWVSPRVQEGFARAGIERPWQHQVQLAEALVAGRHAAICTPTASGKTLAYLMAVLAASIDGVGVRPERSTRQFTTPRATSLYLAPTKALAHDQARAARALGPAGWPVMALDGDSDVAERRFARDSAQYVLTNPDMLHYSLLPGHARWSSFLAGLRYVVVDEAHRYRGVFGAHTSAVLRRLRRLCAQYGSSPTFVFCSATVPNAAEFTGELIGETVVDVVDADTAPRAALDLIGWRPEHSTLADSSRLLADLVSDGLQTVAFVPSRRQAELVSVQASDQCTSGTIASYRSGYLAADRRELEAALSSGALRGVAATNALELGIDIAGMDAVLMAGFPGTLAAMWQQAGRAGRGAKDAVVVLVAREDPLDAFLFAHPELLTNSPVEKAVLYTENPLVLGPHLAAAAQEAPLRPEDERWFGPATVPLAERLAAEGVLRRRSAGWYWTRPDRAVDHIDLRAAQGRPFDIVETATGRVIGTVDRSAVDTTVHPGAIYLHQGESWRVTDVDAEQLQALVVADRPGYYTKPQSSFDIEIVTSRADKPWGATTLHTGDVRLTSRVLGFLRRDEITHEVWDAHPLDCEPHTFTTQATWFSVPERIIADLGFTAVRAGAAAHAAEHTAIGLLPAFVPCDRWDIGGVSTALHPDTGLTTVFVHDGLAGGSGFARRGFEAADEWLRATLDRLATCECEHGCPACVVSPKCGNANQMLDKLAARDLMSALVSPPRLRAGR